jgi:hypothetical protein
VQIAYSYRMSLAAGAAIGLLFGDRLFPDLEALVGDPVADLFLGLAGMILTAVAYEAVAAFLRSER